MAAPFFLLGKSKLAQQAGPVKDLDNLLRAKRLYGERERSGPDTGLDQSLRQVLTQTAAFLNDIKSSKLSKADQLTAQSLSAQITSALGLKEENAAPPSASLSNRSQGASSGSDPCQEDEQMLSDNSSIGTKKDDRKISDNYELV
jgi:hypothetical protein